MPQVGKTKTSDYFSNLFVKKSESSKYWFRFSNKKGICLITNKNIEAGECIISALGYYLSCDEVALIRTLDLYKFIFFNPEDYASLRDDAHGYLVFGAVSWCNHSQHPNAEIWWERNTQNALLHLIALRPMKKGEEITIQYTNIDEYRQTNTWDR